MRIMAPILSFTADEAWSYMESGKGDPSVHLADWPDIKTEMASWQNTALNEKWDVFLKIRDGIMKILETHREKGLIGSSLEACLVLYSEDQTMNDLLKKNALLFPFLFRVSHAEVADKERENMELAAGTAIKVGVKKADGVKCPRCWNYSQAVGKNDKYPELCERCANVMLERR